MQFQKTCATCACIAVFMFAAGCGTELGFIRTGSTPHRLQARGAAQVEVFMTGRPTRPYTELGMVESQQESMSLDDEDTVVAKMREYAGQLGCDALVIFAGNDATQVGGSSSTFTSSRTLKGYRGSCVVYIDAPRPQPIAASASAQMQFTNSCLPNITQLCYGPGGCRGGQRCNQDGKSFTVCDCGQTTSPPQWLPN